MARKDKTKQEKPGKRTKKDLRDRRKKKRDKDKPPGAIL